MELNVMAACYSKLFDVDLDKAWACVNGEYFPEKNWKRENQITDLALARLLYLATIRNSPQKSPFTKNQLSILQWSDGWEKTTLVSILVLAYGINTLLLGVGPFLSLIQKDSNQTLTNETNSSSQQPYFSPLGLALCYAAFGTTVNFISTWSTGTAPDRSSNAFNAKQDALLDMEKTYADLAERLILFYFNNSKVEAEYIASNIDVDNLKSQISSKIQDKRRAERMLEKLRDAVDYINSKQTDLPKEDAGFRHFIETLAEAERGSALEM